MAKGEGRKKSRGKSGISAEDYDNIRKMCSDAQELQEKAREKVEKLKKRIARGAGSGDVIADFVLFNYGSVFEEHQKPYRDLAEKLKGKEGGEFLIVNERKTEYDIIKYLKSRGIMAPPRYFRFEVYLRMGILTGEPEFKVREGELIIPTEKYVKTRYSYPGLVIKSGKFLNLEWKLIEGSVKEERENLLDLIAREQSSLFSLMHSRPVSEAKIYVGKEVSEYFTIDGNIDDAYCKALDLLKRK